MLALQGLMEHGKKEKKKAISFRMAPRSAPGLRYIESIKSIQLVRIESIEFMVKLKNSLYAGSRKLKGVVDDLFDPLILRLAARVAAPS
jgi:hypothetical protein